MMSIGTLTTRRDLVIQSVHALQPLTILSEKLLLRDDFFENHFLWAQI